MSKDCTIIPNFNPDLVIATTLPEQSNPRGNATFQPIVAFACEELPVKDESTKRSYRATPITVATETDNESDYTVYDQRTRQCWKP